MPGSGGQNDQAILQPTLNKGAGGASLTIFVTDCSSSYRYRLKL